MEITAQKILRVTFEWEGVEEMTKRNQILDTFAEEYECVFVQSKPSKDLTNSKFTSIIEFTKRNTSLHYA